MHRRPRIVGEARQPLTFGHGGEHAECQPAAADIADVPRNIGLLHEGAGLERREHRLAVGLRFRGGDMVAFRRPLIGGGEQTIELVVLESEHGPGETIPLVRRRVGVLVRDKSLIRQCKAP